jgi:anti-sigma-K factor RskA
MIANHDELSALAQGYVLGTLSDAEHRAFAEHVETCATCQRETREAAALAEALGRALPSQHPPAALRARVLARVASESSAASEESFEHPTATAARANPWRWLAAAAAIVAVVMSFAAWYYRAQATEARRQQGLAAEQLTALERQVAALQAAASTASQTRSVLIATDLARVELAGQPPAPGAAGRVFWSPTNGLVFTATNLPPLPPGRVYQLWVVADAPISAGIAEANGPGTFSVVASPAAPATAKAFALTIEPLGGQPAPTGPMYLLGSM